MYCLCPMWLARVITLVLVLRHSSENHSMPHTLYLFHKNNRVKKLKTNHSHVCKKFLTTLSVGPQKRHLTTHYFIKNSTSLEQASNKQTKLGSKLSLAVFAKHANQSHASWFALSFNACTALWEQTEIWNDSVPPYHFVSKKEYALWWLK